MSTCWGEGRVCVGVPSLNAWVLKLTKNTYIYIYVVDPRQVKNKKKTKQKLRIRRVTRLQVTYTQRVAEEKWTGMPRRGENLNENKANKARMRKNANRKLPQNDLPHGGTVATQLVGGK